VAVNYAAIARLAQILPASDVAKLTASAHRADALERHWVRRLEQLTEAIIKRALEAFEHEQRAPQALGVDFDGFFLSHTFSTMAAALEDEGAKHPRELPAIALEKRGLPNGDRVPRSLYELRKLWDYYRTHGKIPPRERALAAKIKRRFLTRIHDAFRKSADDFLQGKSFNRENAERVLREELREPYARAKMTVETETTRHYNQARRAVYDASTQVTHYLFVAVRDFATTKWCRSRDGLVYKKGDPLLNRETPPCHWYCRSEILPLTALNPQHLALIAEMARSRRTHQCEPLPPGWNQAAA
jgi:SPP1 gp7 family putative phage head morphogenesis protein